MVTKKRLKKLAGLLTESLHKPKDYLEMERFIQSQISDHELRELEKLAIEQSPHEAAEFLKVTYPDELDSWSNEELEDYLRYQELLSDEFDDMDGDHESALSSAGFGTDEDYGRFDESKQTLKEQTNSDYRYYLETLDELSNKSYDIKKKLEEVISFADSESNFPEKIMRSIISLDRFLQKIDDKFNSTMDEIDAYIEKTQ